MKAINLKLQSIPYKRNNNINLNFIHHTLVICSILFLIPPALLQCKAIMQDPNIYRNGFIFCGELMSWLANASSKMLILLKLNST